DLGLADFGRKEIEIAETEMPGLIALRGEFGASKPLKGARITGSLHMTIQTAVLIETLIELGAEVRWASCNIFSTQDHAAAAIAARGVPVFAIKGETLEDYWNYVVRIFDWGRETTCNMILDDGGDATMFALWGYRVEKGEALFEPSNEEEEIFAATLKRFLAERPGYLTKTVETIKGVSEETTTGVHRLYELAKTGKLPFPAINGNEVVTMEEDVTRPDIFVTATGNMDVITLDHMRAMKNMAIVSNIGHFDSEIQIGALANMKWTEIKPQVDEVEFPDGKKI